MPSLESLPFKIDDVFHNSRTAWVVLALSLLVTVAAWYLSKNFVEQRAHDRFSFQVDDLEAAIAKRMLEYETVLRGGVGLFHASEQVSREEWRTYVTNIGIEQYFPGIQGIGYSEWVKPENKSAFENKVRSEGFEDFKIKPAGDRRHYSSILYLEPFDWRNRRAFGYDMFSNETRRAAMEQARDTGEAVISGKVTLVQETNDNVQAGFLMYLPLYATAETPIELVARRNELKGWVYSPFRMNDLMNGILGQEKQELRFEIFDGLEQSRETLLYDSEAHDHSDRLVTAQNAKSLDVDFYQIRSIELAGQEWSLFVYPSTDYFGATDELQPTLVAAGGLIIDVLLFLIILSISRQKQIAEKRAISMTSELRKFSVAIENSPIKVIITDPKGNIEYVNPSFERGTGYPLNQVEGQNVRILKSGETPKRTYDDLWASIERGENWHGQFRNKRRDGSIYWEEAHLSPIQNEDGEIAHIVGIQEDITERKRIENELEKNLQRFHSAFENVATGAVVADSNGLIQVFNGAAEAIFGYKADEVIGQNVRMLMPDAFAQNHDQYMENFKTTGEKKIIGIGRDVAGRRKNGEQFPLHLGIGQMQVGDEISFIGSVTDLTEIKKTQSALEAALTEANKANNAKMEFLASMSHELRTPLNAILGFSDIMKGKYFGELSEKYVELSNDIHSSGSHLLELVNEILDIASIDAGKKELVIEPIAVEEVVSESIYLVQKMAEDKSLHVTYLIDTPRMMVHADRKALKQILINLLTNSVKFTDNGGTITTTVKPVGSFIEIAVNDTGCGIAPELLTTVTDPFLKGNRNIYHAEEGWGLGLAITKTLAELHGGELIIESQLNVGTKITVTLPIKDEKNVAGEAGIASD
tara:strand:- start:7092 stop:9701 length:2610 start_codon:yes stop_codon:yes gene_type:complete